MTATSAVLPPSAFVAMPHDPRIASVHADVIAPALAEAGIAGTRVLQRLPPADVVGEVLARLRRCDLLVAFVTARSRNVYMEIGAALSLSKPCVVASYDPRCFGMLSASCACVRLKGGAAERNIMCLIDALRSVRGGMALQEPVLTG